MKEGIKIDTNDMFELIPDPAMDAQNGSLGDNALGAKVYRVKSENITSESNDNLRNVK